jgi:hypothetical protein
MEAAQPVLPPSAGAADYPVRYEVQLQEEYGRFLPLVKWLLAFPHYVALLVLIIGYFFAKIGAFFVVLFTGRYPRGIFNYELGVLRWAARVSSYLQLLRDEYPPFSMDAVPEYGVDYSIDYPEEGVARWRPFFAWILAIPYLVVGGLLSYVAAACIVINFFSILFTKKVIPGVARLIVATSRWQYRGNAYAGYLSTRYPPWDMD